MAPIECGEEIVKQSDYSPKISWGKYSFEYEENPRLYREMLKAVKGGKSLLTKILEIIKIK